MYFRVFISSIALTVTLLIASFGICTPIMSSMGMGEMSCMENPSTGPAQFTNHLTFLNSLLPGSNQEVAGAFLVFLALIVPATAWSVAYASKTLFQLAAFYKIRLRRYAFPSLQWFSLPTLMLAFSQGILHTKRYYA